MEQMLKDKFLRMFESTDDIESALSAEKKSLRRKFPAMSSNELTIKAAKIVAKEHKIKYQDVLKLVSPDDNLQGTKTWDKEGNLK